MISPIIHTFDPVDFVLEMKRICDSNDPSLTHQQREILLDILLDKFACRITRLSDEDLLLEAEDWGVF